jgi:phospholipid/cholesterol/gamma-HCH transport system ATP-binding protein
MRRFKFGGSGGGNKGDDEASGTPPAPSSPAPDAGSVPPPGDGQSQDSPSWMSQGQEPFSSDDKPAAFGGSAAPEPAASTEPPADPVHAWPPSAQSQATTGAAAPESSGGDQPTSHSESESGDAAPLVARSDRPADVEADRAIELPPAPERTEAQKATAAEMPSRVSVVDEQPPRPAPPAGASEEDYRWHSYKHYPSGRPDAVEFIDVYKAFGRNRILRGLNMGLPEGMVSMIIGPSGTGKSVCIKHMVGLLYPDEGDILVHGESVPNMPDDDLFEMRKKFGLLFQDGALFGSMDLYDNVAFPLRQHTEKSEDEIEDIVMRRLNEVGLGSARQKMPNELSGGMRKRAGFARALVLEPDILLFDEPDSGLDPVRTALLGELILEIHRDMMDEAKQKQKTHLPTFAVITHDIMSARRVADYINVLWKGRIVEAGPAEDMLNSENPFIRQFLAGESQGPLTMD